MRVAFDARHLQTVARVRGIGRYSRNLLGAFARRAPRDVEWVLLRLRNFAPADGALLPPHRDLATYRLRRPELSQAFINELSSRLRFAFRALAASAFMPVRARVARDLVERAKMLGPVEAGVRVAVTQQSLADATGSVREVVARALRELRREGAIATADDGLTILDPDALKRIAAV